MINKYVVRRLKTAYLLVSYAFNFLGDVFIICKLNVILLHLRYLRVKPALHTYEGNSLRRAGALCFE